MPGNSSDTLKRALRSWPVLLYWGALLGGLWLFLELADEVYEREGFVFDAPILHWFYERQSPALDAVMLALSWLGSAYVLGMLSLLVGLLLWRASRREGRFFAAAMLGAGGLIVVVNRVLARPRPELFEPLMQESSASFPSGHSLGSAAFTLARFRRRGRGRARLGRRACQDLLAGPLPIGRLGGMGLGLELGARPERLVRPEHLVRAAQISHQEPGPVISFSADSFSKPSRTHKHPTR